jgi:hypothetical protein
VRRGKIPGRIHEGMGNGIFKPKQFKKRVLFGDIFA